MKAKTKTKTIDEFCNVPIGSFKKFIEKQQQYFQKLECDRKKRIQSADATAAGGI